jgi:ribosomal protein S18 acetylase RimI-like enzyme
MSHDQSSEQQYEVVGVHQLSEEQATQARALRDLCNRADGLDLKLGVTAEFVTQAAEPYAFLCALDGVLVGYCSLLGGDDPELELCGMVHPDYRRRGIGRALLGAALASAQRRLAAIRVLAICEDASTAGRAFVAAAGGKHSFSENRMEIRPPLPTRTQQPRLQVRPAGTSEAEELARVISASFGNADSNLADEIRRDMTATDERYFLAHNGVVRVGAFKIFTDTPKAYIYAFGVLPEYRRHGYGREILETIIPELYGEGWSVVGLEVDADNIPAQALYRAVGFQDITVYGYYELPMSSS